jgi:thioredoxin 2
MPIITCPNCGAKNRVDERARTAQPVCGKCGAKLSLDSVVDSKPLIATDATFDRIIAQAVDYPLLVDCWAPWCGPCQMLTPTIDQLAAESNGRWVIAKLNVDENPRTAARYNISSIPAMLVFKNGKLQDQLIGLQPKQVIQQRLMSLAG